MREELLSERVDFLTDNVFHETVVVGWHEASGELGSLCRRAKHSKVTSERHQDTTVTVNGILGGEHVLNCNGSTVGNSNVTGLLEILYLMRIQIGLN